VFVLNNFPCLFIQHPETEWKKKETVACFFFRRAAAAALSSFDPRSGKPAETCIHDETGGRTGRATERAPARCGAEPRETTARQRGVQRGDRRNEVGAGCWQAV